MCGQREAAIAPLPTRGALQRGKTNFSRSQWPVICPNCRPGEFHAQIVGSSIYDHIRPQDVEAFRDAARQFKVHILVRRTNPASLRYIGRKGFIPKPVDCKPKTADYDVVLPDGLVTKCAGLVVDPTLPRFEKAFKEGRAVPAEVVMPGRFAALAAFLVGIRTRAMPSRTPRVADSPSHFLFEDQLVDLSNRVSSFN
jgi:hypothetical protein